MYEGPSGKGAHVIATKLKVSKKRIKENLHSMSGPGSSSGKALGCGLNGPDSIPDVRGVEIFLHSFVSYWSYKMCTGSFPRVKAVERRTSHPTSS